VGRAWRGKREAQAAQPKVEPSLKPPTPGQQRRAAKKAAEKADRQALYQDYHDTLVFCQRLTDNEIARMIALGAKPRTIQQPQATADTPTPA
jgi:hypothetical protein